jgi:hypothetical protein
MAIDNIRLKKYIESIGIGASKIEIATLPSYEQIKIARYSNEQFDTAELVFEQSGRTNYKMFDRVSLEDDFFNWYIAGQNIEVIDKDNDIYRTTLNLIELTQKLKNYKVSNLSFNQFSTGGGYITGINYEWRFTYDETIEGETTIGKTATRTYLHVDTETEARANFEDEIEDPP